MRVLNGYWRSSNGSLSVHKCLNPNACIGGYGTSNDGSSPCAKGYGGNLCDQCVHDEDGNNYERIRAHQCSKCPSPTANSIRIAGLALLILLCVMILVW